MRIFSIQTFRRWALTVVILCVVWLVICLIVLIFQCNPIKAAWEFNDLASGEGKCLSGSTTIFGMELCNVLLDIFILCLPIHMIKQLQLPTRRKVIVGSFFLLGGL